MPNQNPGENFRWQHKQVIIYQLCLKICKKGEGGTYKFCMKTTTSHWVRENAKIKYGMRIVIGE